MTMPYRLIIRNVYIIIKLGPFTVNLLYFLCRKLIVNHSTICTTHPLVWSDQC